MCDKHVFVPFNPACLQAPFARQPHQLAHKFWGRKEPVPALGERPLVADGAPRAETAPSGATSKVAARGPAVLCPQPQGHGDTAGRRNRVHPHQSSRAEWGRAPLPLLSLVATSRVQREKQRAPRSRTAPGALWSRERRDGTNRSGGSTSHTSPRVGQGRRCSSGLPTSAAAPPPTRRQR